MRAPLRIGLPFLVMALCTISKGMSPAIFVQGGLSQDVKDWVADTRPDKDLGLHLVAGSGDLGEDSAIIVHGIMDNYLSMKFLAEHLMLRLHYRNVYSLAYDWHLKCHQPALYLAETLNRLQVRPDSIDLIGHSRGCLVVRYSLESFDSMYYLGAKVRNCLLIAGPNQGSKAANKGKFVESLMEAFGRHNPVFQSVFSSSDEWLNELLPESNFLAKLNTPRDQRHNVNYFFFGGDNDNLVDPDSALATEVDTAAIVGGNEIRKIIEGATHGGLKNSAAAVDQIANAVVRPTSKPISAWLEPEDKGFVLHVRNDSQKLFQLLDLSDEEYSLGRDLISRSWYDYKKGFHSNSQFRSYRGPSWQPGEDRTFVLSPLEEDSSSTSYPHLGTLVLRYNVGDAEIGVTTVKVNLKLGQSPNGWRVIANKS